MTPIRIFLIGVFRVNLRLIFPVTNLKPCGVYLFEHRNALILSGISCK